MAFKLKIQEKVFNLSVYKLLEKTNEDKVSARSYSPLVLAYIGDGIYEIFIRDYIVKKANAPVNTLHKQTREFVQAKAQAIMYNKLKDILTEEETAVLKRGRNAKSTSTPKNGNIHEYRLATGVEALVGYLYLENRLERLGELMEIGMSEIRGGNNG
ncbi:MAG: ribonuclease III [Epulopiscium sp. Nuni2H_MBin003]|nr:MAG: ribonuclease III [Epulopiscium sp. Nuni2H_MBin003]